MCVCVYQEKIYRTDKWDIPWYKIRVLHKLQQSLIVGLKMYTDSSEWVMYPNVYGMGIFSDGGIFATKPYLYF